VTADSSTGDLPTGPSADPFAGHVPPDLDAWAIEHERSPFGAELVLCETFGTVDAGIAQEADELERHDALVLLLSQVIAYADRLGTEPALALLRVCSVLGPEPCRAAAATAAERVAGAGVPDRPWGSRIGRPRMLRAWRYGDAFGAQSSIGAVFDYQGREHTLMVLIDHMLGGGVKDCWPTQGRRAKGLRNAMAAKMADNPEAYFEDLDEATAARLLGEALDNPPCPVQDDQIQDVGKHLYLLRSRTEQLARIAARG